MKDRFDLEQDIMTLWSCADDLDKVAEYIVDHPDFKGLSAKHTDEIANLLFGLSKLMNLKGQICFETFEKLVHDGALEKTYKFHPRKGLKLQDEEGNSYLFDEDHDFKEFSDGFTRGTLWKY